MGNFDNGQTQTYRVYRNMTMLHEKFTKMPPTRDVVKVTAAQIKVPKIPRCNIIFS